MPKTAAEGEKTRALRARAATEVVDGESITGARLHLGYPGDIAARIIDLPASVGNGLLARGYIVPCQICESRWCGYYHVCPVLDVSHLIACLPPHMQRTAMARRA